MNVIVFVEGGVIQQVLSDQKGKVIIVDRDTEDCDFETLKTILGDEAYVYQGLTETGVDPELIQKVLKEAEINE